MKNINTEKIIGKERIAKVLSRAGLCSRREAERWISEGKVKINNVLIDSPMLHSISANTKAKSNVFHNIEILQKPTIDQHCGSNHQNLFDNIKVKLNEENFNLFKHGGAGYWKPTHGMFNTFWNVELDLIAFTMPLASSFGLPTGTR